MSLITTEIDVINKALTLLGDRVISSRSENNERARVMDAIYDNTRDRILRECPWNFAVKRVKLSSSGTPVWGDYGYLYPLPTDFLYMMETDGATDYTIEGGNILSDATNGVAGGTLSIRYVSRVTDVSRMDPLFTEALAFRLAYDACEKITQSNTKKDYLYREYETTMARAKRYNGQEDNAYYYVQDEWIKARA